MPELEKIYLKWIDSKRLDYYFMRVKSYERGGLLPFQDQSLKKIKGANTWCLSIEISSRARFLMVEKIYEPKRTKRTENIRYTGNIVEIVIVSSLSTDCHTKYSNKNLKLESNFFVANIINSSLFL